MKPHRFEVDTPPEDIKAAGPTLTVGELRQAMVSVPAWERVSAGYGTGNGFTSCNTPYRLTKCGGAYYLLCEDYCDGDLVPTAAAEIAFKHREHVSWPLYRGRFVAPIAESLRDAPDDAPVFLAYKQPNVFSPVGRHFVVPITSAGVEVFTRFTTDDDGVDVDQIFTVVPDCLSLWGEV